MCAECRDNAPTSFIEAFGIGYANSGVGFYDFKVGADKSGTVKHKLQPWFVAGNPYALAHRIGVWSVVEYPYAGELDHNVFIDPTPTASRLHGEGLCVNHPEYGDQYIFISMCRDTKIIINHHIAKRTHPECDNFIRDLAPRIANPSVQISTDCWQALRTRGAYQVWSAGLCRRQNPGRIGEGYLRALGGRRPAFHIPDIRRRLEA